METPKAALNRLAVAALAAAGMGFAILGTAVQAQSVPDVGEGRPVGGGYVDHGGKWHKYPPQPPPPDQEQIQREQRAKTVAKAERNGEDRLAKDDLDGAERAFREALANCDDDACKTRLNNRLEQVRRRKAAKAQSEAIGQGAQRAATAATQGLSALYDQSGTSSTLSQLGTPTPPAVGFAGTGTETPKTQQNAAALGFAGAGTAAQSDPNVVVMPQSGDPAQLAVVDPRVVRGEMTPSEAAAAREREAKAQVELDIAEVYLQRGDLKTALTHLKKAHRLTPNRRLALKVSEVDYQLIKDSIPPNPRVDALLDAIEDGKGSWKRSVDILTERHSTDPLDLPVRDALNFLQGMTGYASEGLSGVRPLSTDPSVTRDARTNRLVADAIEDFVQGRSYDAYLKLAEAHKAQPKDIQIRDLSHWMHGVALSELDQ